MLLLVSLRAEIHAAPGLQLFINNDEDRPVVWENRQALNAAIAAFRSDIGARYSQLIRQLQEAGLLSSEESAALAAPRLTITTIDLRTVKTPL